MQYDYNNFSMRDISDYNSSFHQPIMYHRIKCKISYSRYRIRFVFEVLIKELFFFLFLCCTNLCQVNNIKMFQLKNLYKYILLVI